MRTIDSIAATDYLDSMDAWTPVIPVILLFAWIHGFLSHPEIPMASMDSMESSRDNDIHRYNQMESKLLIDSIDYMDAAIP
jgi:hypothetical protein